MEEFRESVQYDGDLPLSHDQVVPYLDKEMPDRKSFGRFLFVDVPTYTGAGGLSGMVTGDALYQGLEQSEIAEQIPEALVVSSLMFLGGFAGLSYLAKKTEDRNAKASRIKAQNVKQTSEDLSDKFEGEDLVVVRDYLTGTGEPFERTAETAQAMYHETWDPHTSQYFENLRSFDLADRQISHFKEDELVREFYIGLDKLQETDLKVMSGATNTDNWV